ncbi:MAG: threonylcarbamoyl-AMP synthase [Bacteroidales bacterium]|nr:threonylcarbamoyl-AMP synthase [Bacteroidales bacterium]
MGTQHPEYSNDLKSALDTLREGGVVLFPTDTIWGLGCDATNPEAVSRIFSIKKREDSKSLIILVNGYGMLERFADNVPDVAINILEVADKPLTIIYPRGKNLAPGICAEDGSVGIRLCMDPFCNELITRFRKPVVSTSANISGTAFPSSFREIDEKIIRSVDFVVSYRQNETKKNPPSSIIKVNNDGTIRIIRQ